jgi:FMN reductase
MISDNSDPRSKDCLRLRAIGISGSPSPSSRSRLLVERALQHLADAGVETRLLDLVDLPADALLARRPDPAVAAAITDLVAADIVILGTPVYRASYSGQLKAFFDLFPQEALLGHVVGLIATGAGPGHLLAVDHGLRPLVASLRGLSAAHALYVVDAQFPDKTNLPEVLDQQCLAVVAELRLLAAAQPAERKEASGVS